ncbi:MAG: hypothetical protein WA951_07575, partial [Leeuwenhoekiella sp.]
MNNNEYFKSQQGQQTNVSGNSRLMLRSLDIYKNDIAKAKTYSFEYIAEEDMPSRECTGMDYWGYYNGTNCSQELAARPPQSVSWPAYVGKDRRPSFIHTQKGTLEWITYPTGGRTKFFYEKHAGMPTNSNDTDNGVVGGLRIQKTVDYERGSTETLHKYYYYYDLKAKVDDNTLNIANINPTSLNSVTTSSGIAQQELRFWEKKTYESPIEFDVYGCTGLLNYFQYSDNLAAKAPQNVTYTSVSEVIFRNSDFEGATVTEFYNTGYGAPERPKKPYINTRVRNGQLKSKKVYNDGLDLMSESNSIITNEYIVDSQIPAFEGIFIHPDFSVPNEPTYGDACLVRSPGSSGMEFIGYRNQFKGFINGSTHWSCTNLGTATNMIELPTYQKYLITKYSHKQSWSKLNQVINKTYEGIGVIVDTVTYEYALQHHYLPTRIVKTDSKGLNNETRISYIEDVIGENLYPLNEENLFTVM